MALSDRELDEMLDQLRHEKKPETAPEKQPVPVSVAVRRQQRRRAAGKQAAKPVPVRRQSADAAKRTRRIYDVPEQPVPEQKPALQTALKTAPKAAEKTDLLRRIRLRDAAVGLVLLVFACIGAVSLISAVSNAAKIRKDEKNAALTQCILPLCVMDMPSFSAPDELSDEQFLTAAVWAYITDGRLSEHPTDTNLCTVPAAEIAAAGNARFGTARKPQYRTIGFTDALRFYYDPDQDSYLLPADPRYFGNLPEVLSCTEQNGLYTVNAVCRPEQPAWYQTDAPAVRNLVFTMQQNHGAWQICALQSDAPDAQNEDETEPEDPHDNE
ncbi:MAG: hypothetical protein J5722_00965 [Oscillospiraceae bacterium]|nr:hypothetical protein [Oscillospiraceae bacterium]